MKKFVLSFLVTFFLSFVFSLPSFALSNSDLPMGSYDSSYESTISSHISKLKSENPDLFQNYIIMLPQVEPQYRQIGYYWYNCSDSNNFVISKDGSSYYLSNSDSKSFTGYYCYISLVDNNIKDAIYTTGYNGIVSWQIYDSNCNIKSGDSYIWSGPPSFTSPIELKKVQFRESLEFYFSLTPDAADQLSNTSNVIDTRCWIEIYDSATAIETLKFKPYKYCYFDKSNKLTIQDYLLAFWGGPYYEITQDTLLGAGCSPDSFYTARAYVYNGSDPYEIGNITFKIDSSGLSTVEPDLHDPDHPDDPISKSWDSTNNTWIYNNTVTGEQVNKDDLIYGFTTSVDISVPGSGQEISDFDFNSDFSDDLVSGAGVVRSIFDKIIEVSGLSGFLITVLSIAVVGWFIFGSRR